ncbi:MAG: hypothetical protein NTV51_16890, partial [Verrucomicrobia bacterium]|nr:hypothetical protein [Verrucomicrobiota bacterium]
MSFLVKTPSLPQSAAGSDPKHSSGYRAADVVPVGWGREVFPSKWISDKYASHTTVEKNGAERQYCSIAAAYCAGPIDFIGFVFADGQRIGSGFAFDFAAHGNPESQPFTLENGWRLIVHRGTEDAPATSADALATATGQPHPPYRGVVWIEWIDIELSGGALPSLAVELGRHVPPLGDFSTGDQHPYGVNPFAAAYALCRAANGGDFDDDLLDPAHWGQQALSLESTGVGGRDYSKVYCHPCFTASTTLGDALSQIPAYVDGYLYANNGRLCVGWFPGTAALPPGLPEITEADLEAKPSGGGIPDWNEGATSVVVSFRSFYKDYDEDAARYNAPANRENNISAEPTRKERPFIHDPEQAALIAADSAADSASGEIATNLTVFKSRAAALAPGDLVNWDYAPHAIDLLCRVTARRIRMGAASDVLTLTRERGAFPRPYVAPIDDRTLPADDLPGELDPADVRLWLVPRGLTDLRRVAPLINRPKRSIYRADLHLSPTGASPWEDILDCRGFAAKVALALALTSSATTVRVTSTSLDFPRMAAQSTVAQSDDTLLFLLENELLSVGAITTVATNTYDLTLLRARRGTAAAAHSVATAGWLFYRSELASVEHAEFYRVRDTLNAYSSGIATKHFKLQLFTLGADGIAAPDDPGLALTLPDLTPDDSSGYTVVLTNEAHTVACASDGTPASGQLGAGGAARTDVRVFRGSTALTPVASSPNSDQFSVAVGALTNATAVKEDADTVYCNTLTADHGTIALDVNLAGAFTLTKIFSLAKARAGTNGANGANGANGTNGTNGTNGPVGPGLVYVGAYNAATVY